MIQALRDAGATVREDAPLGRLSFWRVGGAAEILADLTSLEQLQIAQQYTGRVTVLGRGSNALISDAGIPGLVLRLRGGLADLRTLDDYAIAGGGLYLNVLLSRLDKLGLAGAEPFAGVPGTVGGAVVMNAGTTLGQAQDLVDSVTLVLPGGQVQELAGPECGFRYRHSSLPRGAVVAFATLRLTRDADGQRAAQRRAFLERRKATQPLDRPSCGSTFTNPPGDHAARLIDAAGLKGHRIGGAVISEKHANFFLNDGGATAEDIRRLIVHARTVVRDRFGVVLTPEVKLLGDWPADALEIGPG